jgi:hypothetical protein
MDSARPLAVDALLRGWRKPARSLFHALIQSRRIGVQPVRPLRLAEGMGIIQLFTAGRG